MSNTMISSVDIQLAGHDKVTVCPYCAETISNTVVICPLCESKIPRSMDESSSEIQKYDHKKQSSVVTGEHTGSYEDQRTRLLAPFSNNAFRLLGLPSSASSVEVADTMSSIRRTIKISKQPEAFFSFKPLGSGARTLTDVQNAETRLGDPESRIAERLYWFHAAPTKPLIELTPEGIWSTYKSILACGKASAIHDAALLLLIAACITDPGMEDQILWSEVVKNWLTTAENDDYWLEIYDLDETKGFEPSATVSEISSLRECCLYKVFNPVVLIARAGLIDGDPNIAKRALQILTSEVMPVDIASQFESEITGDLEHQFESLCDAFRDRCFNKLKTDQDNSDAETQENLIRCDELKSEYIREIDEQLRIIQTLSHGDSGLVRRSQQCAAECLLSLATAYTWADALAESVIALEQSAILAKGSPLEVRINDKLKSKREQLEAHEDCEASYRLNEGYEITLKGASYYTPPLCACCLGAPTSKADVSYEWEENYGVVKKKKSIRFSFPYCQECFDHSKEYTNKRRLLNWLCIGFTIAFGLTFNTFQYTPIYWLNVIACVAFVFFGSRWIRVRELVSHSARGAAVAITSANDQQVTFGFWNKRYAQLFSQVNDSPFSVIRLSKKNLSTSLFHGLGSVLTPVCFMMLISLFLMGGTSSKSSNPIKTSSRSDSTSRNSSLRQTYISPKQNVNVDERDRSQSNTNESSDREQDLNLAAIKKQLEKGRTFMTELEGRMKDQKDELLALKEQIAPYKEAVKSYEAQIAAGTDVDSVAYQQALDEHNSLVRQINDKVALMKVNYDKYTTVLEHDKDLVKEYNAIAKQ